MCQYNPSDSRSISLILITSPAPSFPAGGSFPHTFRSRRSLPTRRRTDQAGESSPVHARGRPAEGRPAAGPPQLTIRHTPSHYSHRHTHSCPVRLHPDYHGRMLGAERGPPHISTLAEVNRHIFRLCSQPAEDKPSHTVLTRFLWAFSVFKPSNTHYVTKSHMLVLLQENDLEMFWSVTIVANTQK